MYWCSSLIVIKQWWFTVGGNWILRSSVLKDFGNCSFWELSKLTHHVNHMFPMKDENTGEHAKVGQHQVLSLLFPCCARVFLSINSDLCLTSQMFICCLSYSFIYWDFFCMYCFTVYGPSLAVWSCRHVVSPYRGAGCSTWHYRTGDVCCHWMEFFDPAVVFP